MRSTLPRTSSGFNAARAAEVAMYSGVFDRSHAAASTIAIAFGSTATLLPAISRVTARPSVFGVTLANGAV